MVEYDLGLVVGSDGAKGDKGDKGDKGAKGDAGKGITSIQKTSSSGKVDTYTITYSDGSTSTFTVTNGSDASVTVDSALSSSSTNPVQNKVIKTALDSKSDSSHNHDSRYYTETEMDTKLSGKANTTHTHNINDVSNLQSALDGKADDSDIPTKTSDLTNDGDGTNPFLTQHQSLASKTVTVEKQATADTGYFATYVVKQNGSQVGSKINIPKDYLVKSGSVKTCTTANVPVQGYVVGDKYIDFVVNTKDSSGSDEHFYILVSDLVDVPVAWSDITNKPSSFTPSSHSHSISDVSSLQSSLDGKSDTGHTHTKSNITDFAHTHDDRYYTESETDTLLDGKASSSHSHTKSDITDFPSIPSASSTTPSADTTNGSVGTGTTYARSNHTHPKSSLYAEASHNHTIENVTDLQSSLDGKASTSHNHTKSDITDFPNIPSKTSDLTNDSGFLTSHQDISGKEDNSNKVSSWSSTTNNTRYPSEKLVKDSLDGKANSSHTHTKSEVTDFAHNHGQITNGGALTSSAVSVESGDFILITDVSNSNYIRRVANLLASHIKDGTAHSTIGSSANATQEEINAAIDGELGKLESLIGDAILFINGTGGS